MLTDEQLEQRRKGITATDVAKIVGQSPYGCGEDVRLDKMGCGRPFVEHDRVRWGNILEDPIRKDYCERLGVLIDGGDSVGTLRHPREPWAMATPDGLVYPKDQRHSGRPIRGHEIKTHTSWLSSGYGEPGTDQVPAHELIQCAWNIWVCSAHYGWQLDRWDLTVFMDGLPTDYTVIRDPDLEAALIESCRDFWQVHVVGGEPVPPDGSTHYSEILGSRWAKNSEEIVEATDEQVATINYLQSARLSRKSWEAEEARLVQEIKLAIGDKAAIEWLDLVDGKGLLRKITWRQGSDRRTTAWSAVAAEILELAEGGTLEGITADDLEQLAAAHTEITPGSRPFNAPRSW